MSEMKPDSYVVIDLEMTGLSPKTDRIIEIGAVKVKDSAIVQTFGTLVDPHRPIPERVQTLTGITNDMVKGQMEQDEAMEELLSFLGEELVVGQNVTFDYSFLKQWAVNKRIPLEKQACDTLKLARILLPPEQPKNLEALCEHFGIPREQGHRALDDAIQTARLFERLKQLAAEKYPDRRDYDLLFKPRELIYKAKKQTPATAHQLERLKEYRKRHQLTDEICYEALTRNEVSRMMDRYYATYGR